MSQLALMIIRQEHAALSAMLRSLALMIERGPGEQPERFFDVLRAMLFYIDEFPESMHHPKESDLLFPRLVRVAPELLGVVSRLEAEHVSGQDSVRALQHLLLAWELLGEPRRPEFTEAAQAYLAFYLAHMQTEELELLLLAESLLDDQDWTALNAAFGAHHDPLAAGVRDPCYDRLFSRIVLTAPAPIGVGPA
jgi:hemerythrin-like domain-containing protein